MTIRDAVPGDLPALHDLLRRCRLPLDGFDDHLAHTLVADEDGPVGCATLEIHGAYALLRSVAVDGTMRGRGLGQRLTAEALSVARRERRVAVFLLTETAATFFPKLGFVPVSRDDVPDEVKRSVEFTTACPATALAMRVVLQGG